MRAIDLKGKDIGYVQEGDYRTGDFLSFDKMYIVVGRVLKPSTGEVTTLFVREANIQDL